MLHTVKTNTEERQVKGLARPFLCAVVWPLSIIALAYYPRVSLVSGKWLVAELLLAKASVRGALRCESTLGSGRTAWALRGNCGGLRGKCRGFARNAQGFCVFRAGSGRKTAQLTAMRKATIRLRMPRSFSDWFFVIRGGYAQRNTFFGWSGRWQRASASIASCQALQRKTAPWRSWFLLLRGLDGRRFAACVLQRLR